MNVGNSRTITEMIKTFWLYDIEVASHSSFRHKGNPTKIRAEMRATRHSTVELSGIDIQSS